MVARPSVCSRLGFDHGDLVYELEVVLEEGAELGGWAVVGTTLVAAALDWLESGRGAPGPA